ncbi:MAG: bile acid:sodium symporter family protein [Betaproteobacteria bacterium]|nr:MAG: bile acid:sodium symporter family protein [Betaproteobacteria bacterium]
MLVLATMVYAVSLGLKLTDFRYVAKHPRAVLVGLVAQFALLPVATWAVTLWLDLPPAVEAAMMLVAACPGGALSNVITHFGRGNLALSLSISAVSNVLALLLTPLNFAWMVAANPDTAAWARTISVDPKDLVLSLFALLALPLAAALLTNRFAPKIAARIGKPLENVALVALFVFIIGAVAGQWKTFVSELGQTLPVVMAHNVLGLGCGYLLSLLARLSVPDRRAVVIEGGMQNSGLALGIIGLQFSGDLAMVAVAGLWGIWHIVSGGALALAWRRMDR